MRLKAGTHIITIIIAHLNVITVKKPATTHISLVQHKIKFLRMPQSLLIGQDLLIEQQQNHPGYLLPS